MSYCALFVTLGLQICVQLTGPSPHCDNRLTRHQSVLPNWTVQQWNTHRGDRRSIFRIHSTFHFLLALWERGASRCTHTHTHTNTCTPTCTSTTLGIAVQLTCQCAAGWRPWAEPPVVNPYGVISSLCCRRHLSVCHSCLLGADDLPLDEMRTRKHWTRPRTWSL